MPGPPPTGGDKSRPYAGSVDRGTVVSGYEASALEEMDVPDGARWLK